MKTALVTLLLIICCFAAGTIAEPRLSVLPEYKRHDGKPLEVLLGDSRRLFAGYAFAKADAYFHSGMYPSIFDNAGGDSQLSSTTGATARDHTDTVSQFLGEPKDIIDRFSRSFFPSQHTHLDGATKCNDPSHHHDAGHDENAHHAGTNSSSQLREILPWLKLTADLDPYRVENYVVGAFWLRKKMGKVKEAEEFLRIGLQNNPHSYEILFELGRTYFENKNDINRARNLIETALTRWREQNSNVKEPDEFLLAQICWELVNLETRAGNTEKAISYLQTIKAVSPHPEAIEKRILELRSGTADLSHSLDEQHQQH